MVKINTPGLQLAKKNKAYKESELAVQTMTASRDTNKAIVKTLEVDNRCDFIIFYNFFTDLDFKM